jgi:hypothetical protein
MDNTVIMAHFQASPLSGDSDNSDLPHAQTRMKQSLALTIVTSTIAKAKANVNFCTV